METHFSCYTASSIRHAIANATHSHFPEAFEQVMPYIGGYLCYQKPSKRVFAEYLIKCPIFDLRLK